MAPGPLQEGVQYPPDDGDGDEEDGDDDDDDDGDDADADADADNTAVAVSGQRVLLVAPGPLLQGVQDSPAVQMFFLSSTQINGHSGSLLPPRWPCG